MGELPFRWQTDFHFSWSGGWKLNQDGETYERDLVIVIPGKNRRRAVIMADHYDTAYMEDVYGYPGKGGGPRIAAAGADDNHSATAAMMLAAPIFLDLARQGKLESDIWLVHLTGEEFPSDCMGARALCQQVVEGSLQDPPGRRPLEEPGQDPRGRRLRDGHDRPQQRPREGRFPDRPRRESRVDAGWPRRPTRPRRSGTPRRRPGTAGPSAAAPRPRQAIGRRRHDSRRGLAPAVERRGAAALLSPQRACTTPTARSSPTPACRSSCSWRTTTSIARAITTRTTRWRTSISITARP